MPQDFTPTVLDEVRVQLETAFMGDRVDLPLKSTPVSALTMLSKQTAKADELLSRDGECVGYKVEYLVNDSNAIPNVKPAPDFTCELGVGDTVSSLTKQYDLNVFLEKTFTVSDNDCDNSMKFARKVAKATAAAMQKIVLGLNNYYIGELVANAMTPTYTPPNGTILGTTLQYAAARFVGDAATETIGEFYEVAQKEKLSPDYFVLNGTNFNVATVVSNFTSADDDKRSRAVALQFGEKMYFDINNLDDEAGSPSSFIVDPNMIVSAFNNAYTEEMVPMADDVSVFTLPLTYLDQFDGQVKPVMINIGGEMQPVLVDVEHQKKCDTTSKNGTRKTVHSFRALLRGLFSFAPGDAGTSSTGVIHVVRT